MKHLFLVWAALRRRKARSLLTLFSIATAFFLFGALAGAALAWACIVGPVGGLLPALRAARVPVATALRAL